MIKTIDGFVPRTITRQDVQDTARRALGTPYQHMGRTVGENGGLDCAGLLLWVGKELEQIPADFEVPAYTRSPNGTIKDLCNKYMTEVPGPRMQYGDAVLMSFDIQPQHLGILVPYKYSDKHFSMIHAMSNRDGKGYVQDIRILWHPRMRFDSAYVFPGVEL